MYKTNAQASPARCGAPVEGALFAPCELPLQPKKTAAEPGKPSSGAPDKSARSKSQRSSPPTSLIEVEAEQILVHRLSIRGEESLDEGHVGALTQSISECGQTTPVLCTRGEGGHVMVYDGRHRVEAIRRLNADGATLLVNVALDDRPEQKIVEDLCNQVVHTKELGSGVRARYLARRCKEDFGGVQGALARALGVTECTLSKQLAPAKLDPAILACMNDLAQIPINPAASVVALQKQHLRAMITAAQSISRNGKVEPSAVLNACKAVVRDTRRTASATADIMIGDDRVGTASFSAKAGVKLSLHPCTRATPALFKAVTSVLLRLLPHAAEADAA
jgi:hypothetical protein